MLRSDEFARDTGPNHNRALCLRKTVMIAALAATAAPQASLAQAAEPGTASPTKLEEIIVTAQKREQSTQDVGIAINAIDGDALDRLGVEKTEDLANFIPNLSVRKTKGENYPTVTIRGVGLATGDTNYAMSTSSTAMHVDEVYFGSPTMMGFHLFDIERVEVLKGPQGTLFGRNSTAGAINYVTRRPTQEFEGLITADWSDIDVFSSDGYISGAIQDSLSARIAYTFEKGDSYQKDLSGNAWDGPDRLAARAGLLYQPSDGLEFLLTLNAGKDRSGIGRNHLRGISNDVWVADGNVTDGYDIDSHGATLRADWQMANGMGLTSITAYHRVEAVLPDEADGEAIELQDGIYADTVEQFSQELRLSGSTSNINWVLGAYYFDEEILSDLIIDYFVDFYYPGDLRPGVVYYGRQDTEANALFGQIEWGFTDRMTLTMGGRYSYERKMFGVTNLFNNFLADVLGIPDQDPNTGYFYRNLNETDSESWDDFSGKVGLNYKASEDVLLYASASNGFKSGGYLGSVTITRDAVHSPGRPEDLTAYEIGVKSTLFDGILRANLAAFYYDYKDMQAESIVFEDIVPFQNLVNVQETTIQGFDLDVTLRPVGRLELSVGVGYVDGTHDKFVTDGDDYSGSRILNAPEWSVNNLLRLDLGKFSGGAFTLLASHNYDSSIDFNFANRTLRSDASNVFDARLSYVHSATGIELSLWGKNLTEEEVLVHAFDRGDGAIAELYLPPRRFGIGIAVPF